MINQSLLEILQYSNTQNLKPHPLPLLLKDSLELVSNFFESKLNNKLCLVFPSKEFAAQWLSLPTSLFLVEDEFKKSKSVIIDSYRSYKRGDKLILNNRAVVE